MPFPPPVSAWVARSKANGHDDSPGSDSICPPWVHGLVDRLSPFPLAPSLRSPSSSQKHKLNELRDARPPDEVEEENAWVAFKEAHAVSKPDEPERGRGQEGGSRKAKGTEVPLFPPPPL